MSIDIIANPFGENGSLMDETTFETEAGAGMTAERLKYAKFNRMMYRADAKINELIDGTGKGTPRGVGDDAFIKGLFTATDTIASPLDDLCVIGAGDTTKAYQDICYTRIGGLKKLLVCNAVTGCELDVLDIDTLSLESENDLSSGLSTAGSEDWIPYSVCNDGTYAYVLFCDVDSYAWAVQSYDMSTWAPNPAWPATGLTMTDTGIATVAPLIRYVAEGKLAVVQSWVPLPGAAVAIIDATDGTLDGEDGGDMSFSAMSYAYGLCSDGTYVFFGVSDLLSDNVEICSMPIASPGATGCGGAEWPIQITDLTDASTYTGALACSGSLVVMGFSKDSSLLRYVVAETGQGSSVKCSTSATGEANAVYSIVWDGLNFWAVGGSAKDPTDTYANLSALKLTGALKGWKSGGVSDPTVSESEIGFIESFSLLIDPTDSPGYRKDLKCTHDGRDMWCILRPVTGDAAYSGRVVRFAKTLLR